MNAATIANIKKELLLECEEDWVALWEITWEIRNASGPNFNQEKLRSIALEIVADLLLSGKIEAGWPTAGGDWEPWRLTPEAVLARIEGEWDALSKEPHIGSEIVWFTAKSPGMKSRPFSRP